jgi:CrcB protein
MVATPLSLGAIAVGATLGAWLRWGLSLWLNARLESLPLGTLAANLGGGFLIGIAVGFFNDWPALAPEWRLFVVTGFLGGLTTFSTFSAESMLLLQRGDYGWVLLHGAAHLVGSVAMCIAGLAIWRGISG